MALTNIEAKQKLETFQALLDISGSIKELAARPDFAELSKLAYSLPERDQARAEEGRQKIAEYEALIKEQRDRAKDLAAEQDNIDLRVKQLNEVQDLITASNKKLQEREEVVSKREKAADERDKKQTERDVTLSEKEAKLREREVSLGQDVAAFEKEKEENRKRAEEIRRLSEGL